jgi:hypothetical protein
VAVVGSLHGSALLHLPKPVAQAEVEPRHLVISQGVAVSDWRAQSVQVVQDSADGLSLAKHVPKNIPVLLDYVAELTNVV